jgi:Ser/Thr protein kinase RdoA (MazF antagonist)
MQLFHKKLYILSIIILALYALGFASSASCDERLDQTEVSVIKSLIDPLTIKRYVQKNYAFEGPIKCSLLSLGVNDIYLIETSGNKYVLRLSRADKYATLTQAEFLFELKWLDFLNQQQIPVSYPIRQIDNCLCGLIQAPEGPRYATLFSYAEGTTDMNATQARLLGKALAQLHVASDNYQGAIDCVDLGIDQLIFQSVQRIKAFISQTSPEKCAYLDELAEELSQHISTMEITKGGVGIIAGDVHGYNQHFTADNQLTLFDFEFCAKGYRLYDIATFKWCRGADVELWHAFLEGYQSVRTLTEAEIEGIAIFVKARNLWWMGAVTQLSESRHKLDHKFWERAFSQFNQG